MLSCSCVISNHFIELRRQFINPKPATSFHVPFSKKRISHLSFELANCCWQHLQPVRFSVSIWSNMYQSYRDLCPAIDSTLRQATTRRSCLVADCVIEICIVLHEKPTTAHIQPQGYFGQQVPSLHRVPSAQRPILLGRGWSGINAAGECHDAKRMAESSKCFDFLRSEIERAANFIGSCVASVLNLGRSGGGWKLARLLRKRR